MRTPWNYPWGYLMIGRGKTGTDEGLILRPQAGRSMEVLSPIPFQMGDAVMEEGEYDSCIGQTLYGANPRTA